MPLVNSPIAVPDRRFSVPNETENNRRSAAVQNPRGAVSVTPPSDIDEDLIDMRTVAVSKPTVEARKTTAKADSHSIGHAELRRRVSALVKEVQKLEDRAFAIGNELESLLRALEE